MYIYIKTYPHSITILSKIIGGTKIAGQGQRVLQPSAGVPQPPWADLEESTFYMVYIVYIWLIFG